MHLMAGVSAVPSARAHARFFRGCCVKGAQIIGRLPCRRLLARTRITSAHQAFAALILRRALQVGRGKSSLGRGRQRERAGAHEGRDRKLEHSRLCQIRTQLSAAWGGWDAPRQWDRPDGSAHLIRGDTCKWVLRVAPHRECLRHARNAHDQCSSPRFVESERGGACGPRRRRRCRVARPRARHAGPQNHGMPCGGAEGDRGAQGSEPHWHL